MPDSVQDICDYPIVGVELPFDPCFKFFEAFGELAVGREHPAQSDEGAHDVNRNFYRATCVQDGGGLDSTMLCKGVGELTAAAPS